MHSLRTIEINKKWSIETMMQIEILHAYDITRKISTAVRRKINAYYFLLSGSL